MIMMKNIWKSNLIQMTIYLKTVNLSDIAILNIKASDYYCIISLISKNE